jgi:hypothetical protein
MNCPQKTIPEKYLSVYRERINALEDALMKLHKEMGDSYLYKGRVLSGADEGLGAIGWLYYEGIEGDIDKTVLEQGYVLVLGTLLVNRHGFSWEVVHDKEKNVVFMVSHAKLDEPLALTPDAICSRFPVEDIDEGEEADLDDSISEAYDKLLYVTGGKRKRKMGGFLP